MKRLLGIIFVVSMLLSLPYRSAPKALLLKTRLIGMLNTTRSLQDSAALAVLLRLQLPMQDQRFFCSKRARKAMQAATLAMPHS